MNKLNNILKSKEYKDWEGNVKLHNLYNKHNFIRQDGVTFCIACKKIDHISSVPASFSPELSDELFNIFLFNIIKEIIDRGQKHFIIRLLSKFTEWNSGRLAFVNIVNHYMEEFANDKEALTFFFEILPEHAIKRTMNLLNPKTRERLSGIQGGRK